jgi:hypothetical protein
LYQNLQANQRKSLNQAATNAKIVKIYTAVQKSNNESA